MTVSSNNTIDVNISPYYDDFGSGNTEYYTQILFKPSYAVQARELSQIQSMQSRMLKRVCDFFFIEGSELTPSGNWSANVTATALKLSDADINGAPFVNRTVIGNISNAYMDVYCYENETANGDPVTLVGYVTSGTFLNAETITTQTLSGYDNYSADLATTNAISDSSFAHVGNSVFYVRGTPLICDEQYLILEKYNNTPSYRVGLTISEDIIDSDEDSTLLDNATGSSNYAAPGADRYKKYLTLDKKDIDNGASTITANTNYPNFFEFLRVVNGVTVDVYNTPRLNPIFTRQNVDDADYQNHVLQIKRESSPSLGSNGELIWDIASNTLIYNDGTNQYNVNDGGNAAYLDGQTGDYYLDYNNFVNTPDLSADGVATIDQGWFSQYISYASISWYPGVYQDTAKIDTGDKARHIYGFGSDEGQMPARLVKVDSSTVPFPASGYPIRCLWNIPDNIDESEGIKLQIYYVTDKTGHNFTTVPSPNIVFKCYVHTLSDGDTFEFDITDTNDINVSSVAFISDEVQGAYKLHVSDVVTVDFDTAYANTDLLELVVGRNPNGSGLVDDYAAATTIFGIKIYYKLNESNENGSV